ncbi:MAG: Gfo/Idh/MocA family oxidoreductase [Planctomycetota bacterium]
MNRKRYAVVGVSNRAFSMYMDPIRGIYKAHAQLVAMLDKDPLRIKSYNETRKENIPGYSPDEFNKMIKETKPDVIIVACVDNLHHLYVIKALEHDLDVIVEKPLTTSEKYCKQLVDAARKSTGKIIVTFNARYIPHATRIREMIVEGKIGKVVSVDLNWYLDTYHGPNYFRRWNRLREKSGGLTVHKSCHHFDLVQWWIGQKADEVFAYGALNFFGPNGQYNPLSKKQIGDGRTCSDCDRKSLCKYYMRWSRGDYRKDRKDESHNKHFRGEYKYTNYSCRQCLYDPQINIEDTYTAVIKYNGGALLSYSLNSSVPYEGFRLGINGTKGRIEFKELHAPSRLPFPEEKDTPITYIPMFGGREQIDVIKQGGTHEGSDPLLRDELFIGTDKMVTVERQASFDDGIDAVLTGIAVYRSVLEHSIIRIDELREVVYGSNPPKMKPAIKVLM